MLSPNRSTCDFWFPAVFSVFLRTSPPLTTWECPPMSHDEMNLSSRPWKHHHRRRMWRRDGRFTTPQVSDISYCSCRCVFVRGSRKPWCSSRVHILTLREEWATKIGHKKSESVTERDWMNQLIFPLLRAKRSTKQANKDDSSWFVWHTNTHTPTHPPHTHTSTGWMIFRNSDRNHLFLNLSYLVTHSKA